jgi:ribosome maturation protein Sdo1
MKKSEKLSILNSRRIKLKYNALKLREEQERLLRRLERLKFNIDEIESEESALESLIIDQLDFKKMEVSVHIVEEFAPTRMDRLILMILVDGINKPIFKMLSGYETELLVKIKTTGNKLAFDQRIYKFAEDHIEVLCKLNEARDFKIDLNESIDNYLQDYTVEPRLNRHLFF